MKQLKFSLLITLFTLLAFPQSKLDSLKRILKSTGNNTGYSSDTTRFRALIDIGKLIQNQNPDSALIYLTEANKISDKLKDPLFKAESIFRITETKEPNVNYIETLLEYKRAIAFVDKSLISKDTTFLFRSKILKAVILNGIGKIYFNQGNFLKATDQFYKALYLYEQIGNKKGEALILNNLGSMNFSQQDFFNALTYYHKALKINENIGDKDIIAGCLGNIGTTYGSLKNYTKALEYLEKALKLHEELNDDDGIAFNISNIGVILSNQDQTPKALKCFFEALKINEKTGDKYNQMINLIYVGGTYTDIKQYKLAEEYLQRAFLLSKELNSLDNIREVHFRLSDFYEQSHQPNKALEHYKQFIIYRDSIYNSENDKALMQKEIQYSYDKKAIADSLANFKTMEIKEAKHQAEITVKRNQQYALYGGLTLVMLFAGFTYNRFKNSQKQKRIIEQQKKIVDSEQKKTIDSINYAKKIQNSILPSNTEISNYFPHNFLFFKPKDIVSGDFYWFHHHNGLSFIAVADCTGHGVPGAFMTMIAHSNLIEIIAEQKNTEPNKILSNLHSLIFKNLQQHKGDEYSQDGMDISLAVIDHKNNLLHFSGARNHGYIIQEKEVHTLKATSKSIGGLSMLGEIEPERSFRSETIQLKKDSILILSTDGIFDQMNDQDEKFGTNRFKELILKLNLNDPSGNSTAIQASYTNWRGTSTQLDDILLFGLKIS